MKRLMLVLLVACIAASIPTDAQGPAPALNFDAANALTLADDIYLGEVGGVATSSRGDIYVYTRTGHPTVSMATARPRRAASSQTRPVAGAGSLLNASRAKRTSLAAIEAFRQRH